MKIIEIRDTEIGEVAYLFDGKRVIKVLVHDYTGYSRGRKEEVEEVFDEVPQPRRRVRVPVKEHVDFDADEIIDEPAPKRRVVADTEGPARSIIPPGLAGVFLPPDSPGAAVERRMV